jgi:signal transduction histidine kinase
MKRLVQAVTHLINNAVKYTPDNGTITISGLTIEEKGQPCIELIVTDTGIGINPEDHEKIFEKFYRVGNVENHSTSSVKFKGAGPGLGLPLVAGIAKAHGGRVWVESPKYDETTCPGSQFHLILLVAIKVEQDVETPAETASPSLVQTRHWRKEDLKAIQERVREREKEHQ